MYFKIDLFFDKLSIIIHNIKYLLVNILIIIRLTKFFNKFICILKELRKWPVFYLNSILIEVAFGDKFVGVHWGERWGTGAFSIELRFIILALNAMSKGSNDAVHFSGSGLRGFGSRIGEPGFSGGVREAARARDSDSGCYLS